MRISIDRVADMFGMSPKNIHYAMLENTMLCNIKTLHNIRSDILRGIHDSVETNPNAKRFVILSLAYYALCNIHFMGSYLDEGVLPADILFLKYSVMLRDERLFMRSVCRISGDVARFEEIINRYIEVEDQEDDGMWMVEAASNPNFQKLDSGKRDVLLGFVEKKIRWPKVVAMRKSAMRAVYYHTKNMDLSKLIINTCML